MERELFDFKKVKLNDGKVEVSYDILHTDGDVSYQDRVDVSSPRSPHPDLEDALNALRPMLADSNCLNTHRNLPSMVGPAVKAVETLETVFKSLDRAVIESVVVTGISVQGIPMEGDINDGSVVITGKHKVHNTSVAMNSPKINLSGELYKFEKKLAVAIDTVIDEVYQYVFEGKSADLELPFQDEEAA